MRTAGYGPYGPYGMVPEMRGGDLGASLLQGLRISFMPVHGCHAIPYPGRSSSQPFYTGAEVVLAVRPTTSTGGTTNIVL